ncbi:diacylglycerol kinase family protein [Candidatus Kuenenbacteria bacterium]|nr:diacylglycerol kinase family protein [Candidatus Kuenenbacteria bacterium]
MLNIKRLYRSFKYAFKGLGSLIKKEQNFRIHLIASIVVLFGAIYFNIKLWQWCLIILMAAGVLILEMLNTAFERLLDILKPRIHDYVGEIKNIMSAVVLVAAIASVMIALIIFIPYF